jgi:hypothetical protein
MRRLRFGLIALEVGLASLLLLLGVPRTLSALDELNFKARLGSAGSGEVLDDRQSETTSGLDAEIPTTAPERLALAFALLSRGDDPASSEQARNARVDRAARLFGEYLAEVPADGRAWAGLASAQIRRGDMSAAATALKMSVLTAPWSATLVQWRCGMAITLFRTLDDESRELMTGQFRVAAQRSPKELVKTVRSLGGVRVARLLLAPSPDELIRFETELARAG